MTICILHGDNLGYYNSLNSVCDFLHKEAFSMLHEPAASTGKDPAGPYKRRLGIWMFLFYALFYAGFVAINLLNPLAMGMIVFAGLNLATVYGIGLIFVAFIQSLVYDAMCRKKEAELEENPEQISKKTTKTKKGKA